MDSRKAPMKCVQKIRWSSNPAMSAWMEEHNDGRSVDELSAMFEQEHGFPLSRPQIIGWRQLNRKNANTDSRTRARRSKYPLGSIKVCKRDGIKVKVKECSDVSGQKDDWHALGRIVYAKVHGEVPDGCSVFAVDRNVFNVHPDNLVAVPIRLAARVNHLGYHDRDSLEQAVAIASLGREVVGKLASTERKCAVCGREFAPDIDKARRCGRLAATVKTCPECIAAGRKPPIGERYDCRCRVCGEPFNGRNVRSCTCDSCKAKYRELGGTYEGRLQYSHARRFLSARGVPICGEWWK